MRNWTISLLVLGLACAGVGADEKALVQIAMYPYFHGPAKAWRVTVLTDGMVRYEESDKPVKIPRLTPEDGLQWTEVASEIPLHVSRRKLNDLVKHLRELELSALRFGYLADHEFTDPDRETKVIVGSEEPYAIPMKVHRFVTHGATFRLTVTLPEASTDTSVYEPQSALEYEKPEHPDRAAITKIIAAWHYVLKTTGPINGYRPRDLSRWIR